MRGDSDDDREKKLPVRKTAQPSRNRRNLSRTGLGTTAVACDVSVCVALKAALRNLAAGLGQCLLGAGVMAACASTTSSGAPPTAAQLGEPSRDIDPELIGAAVRDNSRHFQLCYQAARERNPGLAGQLAVRFVINPDGSVGQAALVESSLPADVSKCVVGAFSNLKLPKQESAVVAQYPMFFEPS
jgi:hypothetical protein